MKKKLLLLGIVLSILISSTGCIRVETYYKVNRDNTGYNTISVAYNEPVTKELGLDSKHIMKEVYNVTNGLDKIKDTQYFTGALDYSIKDMKYKGESKLVYFTDIRKVFIDGESVGNTIGYTENNFGINRIEMGFGDLKQASVENNILDRLFYEAGGEILFSIEVDTKVIHHNATRVEGKKYIWDLMDVSKNPDKYGKKAFIEYRKDNLTTPSRGGSRLGLNTRKDVETALDKVTIDSNFHINAMKDMGLLVGTDKGLEPEKLVTRIEGTILYSRLLGIDNEIEQFKKDFPNYKTEFTDVPQWAEATINYLHFKGLVSGVGYEKFGSDSIMTENQYLTLILRSLGYSEIKGDFSWKNADIKAKEIGFYTDDIIPYNIIKMGGFNRRFLSYISYNSLFIENKITGDKLLDNYAK